MSLYLVPQLVNGVPAAANDYRAMLNAFSAAIHGVVPSDIVAPAAWRRSGTSHLT